MKLGSGFVKRTAHFNSSGWSVLLPPGAAPLKPAALAAFVCKPFIFVSRKAYSSRWHFVQIHPFCSRACLVFLDGLSWINSVHKESFLVWSYGSLLTFLSHVLLYCLPELTCYCKLSPYSSASLLRNWCTYAYLHPLIIQIFLFKNGRYLPNLITLHCLLAGMCGFSWSK